MKTLALICTVYVAFELYIIHFHVAIIVFLQSFPMHIIKKKYLYGPKTYMVRHMGGGGINPLFVSL